MSLYKITTCKFCRSNKIVNTVDYINDIQKISCTNCKVKYAKLGKTINVLERN